jgi:NAD(P)-dependent dehydrogenase (short-subunit alcohol dehydrogenase family)
MSTDKWTAADLPSFTGRTVVVTGATSGLGLVTATELARVGARVVLAVRDVAKGTELATQLGGGAEVREVDLGSLDSIRAFAEGWSGDIDVFVNNAGIMNVPKAVTVDGFERHLGVDHLGPFALTNLLLPHVTDRVVTVSSIVHRSGTIVLDDLMWENRSYKRMAAYGQAKLANLLFSLELQRRLDEAGSPVRSLTSHPGYAATNLQSRTENPVTDLLGRVGNAMFAQSAEAGALPSLYAASQDLPGGSYVGSDGFGEYRGSPTLVGRSVEASDAELATQLWDASEKLTGVTFPGAALRR